MTVKRFWDWCDDRAALLMLGFLALTTLMIVFVAGYGFGGGFVQ